MKTFGGKILFLDRDDINTDEIIPAKYLTENSKDALKPYLLEDLKLNGFDPKSGILEESSVIISKSNFGCGSSREHAPWALEVNDINVVIAESFARIFRQNMFNLGMLALELPKDVIDKLFNFSGRDSKIDIDIDKKEFRIYDSSDEFKYNFELNSFEEELIRNGGWVEYADKKY